MLLLAQKFLQIDILIQKSDLNNKNILFYLFSVFAYYTFIERI